MNEYLILHLLKPDGTFYLEFEHPWTITLDEIRSWWYEK